MIIVTGGAGFIGSALVWHLNQQGIDDILVVDELGREEKWQNLASLRFADYLHKDDFLQLLERDAFKSHPRALVHLGACSSTTEQDADFLMRNNYRYTRTLAEWALARDVRFIYASSAATYGDGARGYCDHDDVTPTLLPLNKYGYSKQAFDLWALRTGALDKIVGLKFFNVYGPNEYHKGDMSSVVVKAFHQIMQDKVVRLFKSDHPDYADGCQQRDFVYVKDCVAVIAWLIHNPHVAGLFNLGSGTARTWNDLVSAVFAATEIPAYIEYIDLPAALRGRYQYFTQADMGKLRATGCPVDFPTLEDSVRDYVLNYLLRPRPYLGSLG
jgi:ADP-L-glycero-D-manno-heptose 6-epimerase